MKKKLLIKALVAILVLVGCVVALPSNAETIRTVKVQGTNGKELESFDANDVDYIEFGDHVVPYADFATSDRSAIVFYLAPGLNFKMIKVPSGTYALQATDVTWNTTKNLSTYYIAEFECTQAVWKWVMGSVPDGQTATGDDYPVANVSWNDITGSGSDTFLKLLNAKLPQIKANSAADVVAVLGKMKFRLPNQWEWEYAAAGGPEWNIMNYYFSGTSGTTADALNTVAVNSVSPNKASSVAVVGSKMPNNLGIYDMSGNVAELLSGLGYPGHESSPGFMFVGGNFRENYIINIGGKYFNVQLSQYRIVGNFANNFADPNIDDRDSAIGFRLAL